jgi:hypothetical protein
MDNADYLDVALRLANASLDDVADLRAALHDEPWWSERAGPDDLAALIPVANGLRRALSHAVDANGAGVLREVNALLAAHPLRPRLSAGHSTSPDTAGCANFYLDTSTNKAKRFCSPRCANRMHVAAFRSRQRT